MGSSAKCLSPGREIGIKWTNSWEHGNREVDNREALFVDLD